MSVHDRHPSPRSYAPLAPAMSSTPVERYGSGAIEIPATDRTPPGGKRSPLLQRITSNPKIVVKKEPPSSPSLNPNARHRPRKLDLNTTTNIPGPLSSRPSAGASMHDVGLACLSPGFQTQDPSMREQLQRSISVRDQQRSIIESRLLKSAKGDHTPESARAIENPNPFSRAPSVGKKRPPPSGLSIVPPRAEQFANERVIQSAPLGQTFTGRDAPPPSMRDPQAQIHGHHVQHVPAIQTNNRLPPIFDVFSQDTLQPQRPPIYHANSTPVHLHGPPLPSPGFPPQTAHPMSQPPPPNFDRPREYRSAEEAVAELTGGREDLQPKIVHYGARQPPTPPSPHPQRNDHLTPYKYQPPHLESGAGRRRTRNEYEADSSPPLGNGPDRAPRIGPFGLGRDSPATQSAKKEEFMHYISKAWDLWHA
ncbi:hypothetical protein LTR05_006923 [Lithohypha guttulata]|uniref:Uncharacterized protein n=2 Tax=Lithohypha guttulata TaxID=1690604 RepID=A0AAN7SVZ8_9EURO|nr:hypothetical protein LTR05_006923 [Lithohypha guttulata]